MRSSYLRLVTFYIHPFVGVDLASTLLREDQALFGTFIPPRAATVLFTTLHAAAINPGTIGRVETVHLEFKRACTPDFESHRSLPDK
jgi:hypothetical protein